MRTIFASALPLSLVAISALAWDDMNYLPVPVDFSALTTSTPQDGIAFETSKLRFLRLQDQPVTTRAFRRYKGSDIDTARLLKDVQSDFDNRVRPSMSKREKVLYDGVMTTGYVAWGGYSFLRNGEDLTFFLKTSDQSKAKFSFNKGEEGRFVYSHTVSPRSNGLIKFEVTTKGNSDGVFLKYTRTLN